MTTVVDAAGERARERPRSLPGAARGWVRVRSVGSAATVGRRKFAHCGDPPGGGTRYETAMPSMAVGTENSAPIEIHCEDHGPGQPVVLVHGYPLNGASGGKQELALL
jgi:pimeloyl-ACP methyl ester carboxylesterase